MIYNTKNRTKVISLDYFPLSRKIASELNVGMKIIYSITLLLSVIVLIAGCETIDLTKNHIGIPPICEIHNCPMTPEYIYVYGEVVYVPKYQKLANGKFPHHGGHRLNFETENTPWDRDIIDFVCPECDRLYNLYWKKERQKQAKEFKNKNKI